MGRAYGKMEVRNLNAVYPAWIVQQEVDPDDEFHSMRYLAEDASTGYYWTTVPEEAKEFNSQGDAQAFITAYRFGGHDVTYGESS